MSPFEIAAPPCCVPVFSPLMLADRLISLAQDADRAGFRHEAEHLVCMVYAVLDATVTDRPAIGRDRRVRVSGPELPFAPSDARPIRGSRRLQA